MLPCVRQISCTQQSNFPIASGCVTAQVRSSVPTCICVSFASSLKPCVKALHVQLAEPTLGSNLLKNGSRFTMMTLQTPWACRWPQHLLIISSEGTISPHIYIFHRLVLESKWLNHNLLRGLIHQFRLSKNNRYRSVDYSTGNNRRTGQGNKSGECAVRIMFARQGSQDKT